MTEEKKEEVPTQKFDPVSFKNEILESVKETNKNIIDTVLASRAVEKNDEPVVKSVSAGNTNVDFNVEEFKSEMEAIGIDENQVKGMVNLMGKLMAKKAPDLKREIISEVDEKTDIKEKKVYHTQNIRMTYPDADNKGSELFKMARIIYNQEMSDQAKAGPDAEAIAVERAAARLGIKPLTMASVKSRDAVLPAGDGSGSATQNEVSRSLADFFNVDHSLVNKKFKEMNSPAKR